MDIVVKNLAVAYGEEKIFENFNIEFLNGQTSVIMGRSGIGKTTLLNSIAGLIPYTGSVEGVDGVSYVFQEDRLIGHLTTYENLDFALSGRLSKSERKEKIKSMLFDVELLDKAGSYPGELSGGERKRVSLARAFLSPKKLLIMDEPFTSLDLGLKTRITELFLNLKSKYQKTVIAITHDVEDALSIADKIFLINRNEVAYSYKFNTPAFSRDLFSEEINGVRKEITNFLKDQRV